MTLKEYKQYLSTTPVRHLKKFRRHRVLPTTIPNLVMLMSRYAGMILEKVDRHANS